MADPIRDMYTWTKFMRMRQRWGTRGVVQVQGAQLVRDRPTASIPEQVPEPAEAEAEEA